MKKREKLVKSIGYTLILVTCIAIVISFVYEIKTTPVNDSFYKYPTMEAIVTYFFFVLPVIWEELLLLRSVYKLTCFSSRISAKICYIISIAVLCVALVFQLLVFTGVITKDIIPEGPRDEGSVLVVLVFWIQWSAIFLSFILGSVKSGKIESDA